ncbi:hypothetical protein H5410_052583, partial [Solanum commersonii]
MHTCGLEHLTSHNPHATTKVIGAYFKDRYPEGKGPSTKDWKTLSVLNWDARHQSIRKMVLIVFLSAHYGCCMRHSGVNIRNNFHNASVVYHFYKAAKAYNIDVYSIMTTNIVESINSIFFDEREYLITALFDAINRRFAEKFHERRMKFINAPTIFVPVIEKDIAKNINLGNKLLIHQTANYKYIVTGHDEVATVDLLAKSCTCKVFDIDKMPCPHAMAALRCQYGDDYGRRIYEYSSSYYKVEVYLIAYVEEIKPERLEEGPQKDINESGNHFQRKKINVLYAKELVTRGLHAPSKMLHKNTF